MLGGWAPAIPPTSVSGPWPPSMPACPGRPPKLPPDRYPQLRALVAQRPDATLVAHVEHLAASTGVHLSPSHRGRLLRRLGLTLKKRP
jgi:transposase